MARSPKKLKGSEIDVNLGHPKMDEIRGAEKATRKAYSYMVTESQGTRNKEVRHLRTAWTSAFKITRLTKDNLPDLPFFVLKNAVLPKKYDLSLVVVGDARSKQLNQEYRGKTYIPNVLSFPLTPLSGEIFLNLKQAKREHMNREESFDYFVALLFIHSMLHLIGSRHGSTMEETEQKVLKKFNIKNLF